MSTPYSVQSQDVRMEKCVFKKEEILLPDALVQHVDVFLEVVSAQTWQSVLTDAQRRQLLKFLPTFAHNDVLEKQSTLRQLFNGGNFKFGNPLKQLHRQLREGMFSPDIAKYAALCRKAKMKDYRYQQQVYYANLLKEVLVNRQKILEQVQRIPIDEPLHLELSRYKPPPKERCIQYRVKRKYNIILKEVYEECGVDGSSSEDDDEQSALSRSRRQLFKSLHPDGSTDTQEPAVIPTFAPRPALTNGDIAEAVRKSARAPSPMTVTEDDFKELLRRHRKRRSDNEDHAELDVRGLDLQDIISRTQPQKKSQRHDGSGSNQGSPAKKKLKDKGDRKKKKTEIKEEKPQIGSTGEILTSGVIPPDENAMDGITVKEEISASLPVDTSHISPIKQTFGQYANFFSLIRDLICESSESKVTISKLEERVREWQESPSSSLNPWFTTQTNWTDLLQSALKFLSGDVLGLSLENFIPYLDYKERAQQWKWIGQSRDADDQLLPLYKHWLENREELNLESSDAANASPPPPRSKTTFVVRPTSEEEKMFFRSQERQRFQNPHKAFTYSMHGYESVVGPVKGVYSKDNAMNKAREHALLVSDRPAFVTILTLVRDAAARLPNGEGTRGDICELLKDSQFLAPGVTDAQINTVVSGALDRLHYEKDPCVKYDVNRKLWIYLHRSRTEDEFERIHQAQGAAAKAKKALQKPKAPKKVKEVLPVTTAATLPSPRPSSAMSTASSEGVNVDSTSPISTTHSPRGHGMSPKTPQVSPKLTQASTKQVVTSLSQLIASPKSMAATFAQTQGSPKTLTTTIVGSQATGSPRGTPTHVPHSPQNKPAAVTFVQPQASPKQAMFPSTPSPQPVQSGNKPVAFSLIQSQGGTKIVHATAVPTDNQQSGTRTVVITSKPEIALQRVHGSPQHIALSPQHAIPASPKSGTSSPSPLAGSPKPGTPPVASMLSKPKLSKIVQPGSTQQVMSVGNLIANKVATVQKQGGPIQGATTIKIQGGNIMQPAGGKPTTLLSGKPVTMQRALSVDHSQSKPAVTTLHSAPSTPVQGQPATAQVTFTAGGKPTTLMITKPAASPGGKPVSQQLGEKMMTSSEIAQLIQTATPLTGKPATISGKPIIIGGKPAMISGKPFQIGGKPIQLTGKPGQIGILQGQQAMLSNIMNIITQASSTASAGSNTTTTATASANFAGMIPHARIIAHSPNVTMATPSIVGQILQSGATILQSPKTPPTTPTQSAQGKPQLIAGASGASLVAQPKIVTPGQGGIVVTQLTPVGATKPGTPPASQGPVSASAQAALQLGTQIIVQPTQAQAKMAAPPGGVGAGRGVRPTLITGQGGKPGQNIQVLKTVLTQPGGKPAHTTIVLTQAGSHPVTVVGSSTGQVIQQVTKATGTVGKSKAGPVYARIITPPPGIRLAAIRPGQVSPGLMTPTQGVSVIQTVGKLTGEPSLVTQTSQEARQSDTNKEEQLK